MKRLAWFTLLFGLLLPALASAQAGNDDDATNLQREEAATYEAARSHPALKTLRLNAARCKYRWTTGGRTAKKCRWP